MSFHKTSPDHASFHFYGQNWADFFLRIRPLQKAAGDVQGQFILVEVPALARRQCHPAGTGETPSATRRIGKFGSGFFSVLSFRALAAAPGLSFGVELWSH
jgi:hypothetical protein